MIERAERSGFTLLTVLWVLSTAGILSAAAMVAGRNAVGAARNRVEAQRAYWLAVGCARRAEGVLDDGLARARREQESAMLWRTLDLLLDSSSVVHDCDVAIEATGTRLDVNAASVEMVERLLEAQNVGGAAELAREIDAARDSAPFTDVAALRSLLPNAELADSLFSVEPGRVSLSSASATVLQSIPGFTAEVAAAVVARRMDYGPLADLNEVVGLVSRASAAELERRFQDAARVATVDPDAWVLRARARSGFPSITVVVEWRIVRQGDRVTIARSTVQ